MLNKAIEYISNLFNFKKVIAIVFVDSNNCICNYYLNLLKEIKELEVIQVKELNSNDTISEIRGIKSNKGVLIFLHGTKENQCYFNKEEKGKNHFEVVTNKWWNSLSGLKWNPVYFHVCYGSTIIEKGDELESIFLDWVSYSNKVIAIYSEHNKIKEINLSILKGLVSGVKYRKNSESLKLSIESSYKCIEADLIDEKKRIVGHSYFIQMLANNSKILTRKLPPL